MFGFLNIFKSSGMTSNSVVSQLRRQLGIKQIGFAGTLDPLAEGVLPVAVGKATKLIDYLNNTKSYIATAKFGEISTTYDCEGEITQINNPPKITKELIEKVLKDFEGEIKQKPPIYSAVHVNGKRLYELARKNLTENEIEIPERTVIISKIKLVQFDKSEQTAMIEIECSKGTYIRSVVSDLGKALNSGAVMTRLVRTSSSGFEIDKAILPEIINTETINDYLIPVESKIAGIVVDIDNKEFEKIRHGNPINTDILTDKPVLIKHSGEIISLGFISNGEIIVKKVFI